jgi:GTP-binding protein EngB required for normal cell division
LAQLTATALDGERAESLTALLGRAHCCLDLLRPSGSRYTKALSALRERLIEERLQVAVLGQFKRGKSTFLNALLGEPLLPTGVVPLTAIPTFIHWGSAPAIRVSFLDGRALEQQSATDPRQIQEQLFRVVTEEANPRNRFGVARVDVFYPAPILSNGIVLIDTPGVGSTLRHQTDAAHEVLPECDVGFFVLSADPPVTEAELAYLERVRPTVGRLFFVLNKIDYLAADERRTATEFLRRTLREHLPPETEIPIFALSAREGLEAKRDGDPEGVAASGLAEIEHRLTQFLAHEKVGSLQGAVITKTVAVLDAAAMEVALGVRALEMPVEDLERQAERFAEALCDIQQQRLVARDLLAGDRRRALERLEDHAATLRREARSTLVRILERILGAAQNSGDAEAAAQQAIAAEIPEFFEPKLAEISRTFTAEVEKILAGHVRRAASLIGTVRQTAAALFEIPSIAFDASETFVIAREPYWVTQKWSETLNPFSEGALDKLLPTGVRAARLKRRLIEQVEELVQRNVENLRWAILQNLDAAFRRFEGWFDERLAEAIEATRGAIDAALIKRREHTDQARDHLLQLRQGADLLAVVREEVKAQADNLRPPTKLHDER